MVNEVQILEATLQLKKGDPVAKTPVTDAAQEAFKIT